MLYKTYQLYQTYDCIKNDSCLLYKRHSALFELKNSFVYCPKLILVIRRYSVVNMLKCTIILFIYVFLCLGCLCFYFYCIPVM